MVEESEDMIAAESRSFSYLTTFVGNSKQDDLRLFLRFVTGSSVMIDEPIKVIFNKLDGLGRRLISHTCYSTLELPVSYATYPEFEQEMMKVLTNELSWVMDAV